MTAVATGMDDIRSSRWLMPVLVASLALNLVVVGAAGSLLWRGYHEPATSLGRRVVSTTIGYFGTLPRERQEELRRLTKVEQEIFQPLRQALIAARQEVNKALIAEPFDEARFLAAQARMEEADKLSRAASFKLQLALARHFTPAERLSYVNWREKQVLPQNPLVPEQVPANPPQR